jgi:sulfite dehydrogenase (quinone) subunit SoeC
MALRELTEPRWWMVKPTPQTEWIEQKGLLVWFAEVATSIGSGLYLVSMLYHNLPGMLAGWLIILLLKMPPHLIYLGKPLRFWRMIPPFTPAWRTSWITRGMLFTLFFSVFAPLQMLLFNTIQDTGWGTTLMIVTGGLAFMSGIYSGFVLSYCRSIPLWNSALLPFVFILAGVADGLALQTVFGNTSVTGGVSIEAVAGWVMIINIMVLVLIMRHAFSTSKTGKYSVMLLLKGKVAPVFWAGLVGLGMAIPLAVSISVMSGVELQTQVLLSAAACHTIGAFCFKYCLLKAGIHNPLLPATTSTFH